MFYTSLLVLALGDVFANAESTELFPMPEIFLGMSSQEVLEKYPTEDRLFCKENDGNNLAEGILNYWVTTNKFWDSLGVSIEDSKVAGMVYVYFGNRLQPQDAKSDDGEKRIKNIKPLFEQLREQLGSTFEKRVIHRLARTEKVRSAMYVWAREKDVVVFLHTPIALHKKGIHFEYQLNIESTLDIFASEMATDSLPEDELLWADAMGENGVGGAEAITKNVATEGEVIDPTEHNDLDASSVKDEHPLDTPVETKQSHLWIYLGIGILFCLGVAFHFIYRKGK